MRAIGRAGRLESAQLEHAPLLIEELGLVPQIQRQGAQDLQVISGGMGT